MRRAVLWGALIVMVGAVGYVTFIVAANVGLDVVLRR